MSSVKTTQIDGDVSVGRDVAIGRDATLQGGALIKGNVKILGVLRAYNIKSCYRGLFVTRKKLIETYPHPLDGWWAIVGKSVPGPIFVGDGGEWVATGEIGVDPEDALNQMTAKKYTDEKTAETLKAAQDYHDEHEEQLREDMDDADRAIRGGFADADRETLQKAKEYADRQDAKKLAEARKYADDMDEETLAAANRYTDNKTEATLFPVPVGTVLMWPATGNIPPDYRLCDGSALLVEDYPELYAVIGAGFNNCKNYNDVNYVTQSGYFRIPDLRGRFVVGHNAEAEEYRMCGNAGGEKSHKLTVDEMPSHSHGLFLQHSGKRFTGGGKANELNSGKGYTDTEGKGLPHENRPPYYVLAYIIRVR